MTPSGDAGHFQSITHCFEQRMACQDANRQREEDTRKIINENHGVVMKELGLIKDYMAEKRGEEKAMARATHNNPPIQRRSFAHGLGAKILEWVIITAVMGGLYAALKHDVSAAAPSSPQPPANKP